MKAGVPEGVLRGPDPDVGVVEAYCDDRGRVWAVTKEPVEAFGTSCREARADLRAMGDAFRAPVLPWEGVPEEGAEAPARDGPVRRPRGRRRRRGP